MKGVKSEVPDAHFTVDKQNVSLWPRGKDLLKARSEPGAQPAVCWSFNKCSPFLSAEPPPKTGRSLVLGRCLTVGAAVVFLTLVLLASVLLQAILCKSSALIRAQPFSTEANARIQTLTSSWEAVDKLNAQIPGLQRDLDKASALNAKVQGLQSSLENISKLLKQQNDILQAASQGWKYFRGNFYYFSRISKTWYSAEQFCMSRNSHLTSVTSESEQEFLYKMAGGLLYWIGLTKAGSEGDWYWVDDTPFNKVQSARFWIPGEPNNTGNNEHCANIKQSSLRSWNDASCDNTILFICKRPYIPSEP
nr:C-type lectin domain family 4 member K [Vicugna pacos]